MNKRQLLETLTTLQYTTDDEEYLSTVDLLKLLVNLNIDIRCEAHMSNYDIWSFIRRRYYRSRT